MKKLALSLSASLILSSIALADVVGMGIGGGAWNHNESGWIQKDGNEIDIEEDLHFNSENNGYIWAYVEHPLPLFPNIKIVGTKLSNDGEGPVSKNIKYGDLTIHAKGYEKSSFQLDQLDTVLYYELIDLGANLDAGINIKYIDGSAEIAAYDPETSSILKKETKDFTITIPMLYLDARMPIPMTNLEIGMTANAIAYDSNEFYDTKIYLNYDIAVGTGVEIGYRYEKIKIDDIDDIFSDLEIKGVYAGVYFRF